MLILGLSSTIVFLLLDLRYAYALGVLCGLLNIVPVLGAAVSLALALLVAAIDSWGRVLGVAIFFLVYLQVENSWLVPRIMKNRVNLPALGIFVALAPGFGSRRHSGRHGGYSHRGSGLSAARGVSRAQGRGLGPSCLARPFPANLRNVRVCNHPGPFTKCAPQKLFATLPWEASDETT